jgi:uncharacterized protein YacL
LKLQNQNIILVILFALYALIALLKFPLNNELIVTVIFTIIALILTYYINNLNFSENKESDFNSYPLALTSYTFYIIQIFVSLILLYFAVKMDNSIIIQAIILVAYIILALLLYNSKHYIEDQEQKDIENVYFHEELEKSINLIVSKNHNKKYTKNLNDLKDLIRYSNPTSNFETKSLDDEIFKNMEILNDSVLNNKDKETFDSIHLLKDLINDRDIKLKH